MPAPEDKKRDGDGEFPDGKPAKTPAPAAPEIRSVNAILRDLANASASVEPFHPTAKLWIELRDAIDAKTK